MKKESLIGVMLGIVVLLIVLLGALITLVATPMESNVKTVLSISIPTKQ